MLWKDLVVVFLGASGSGPYRLWSKYAFVEVVAEFVLDEVADQDSVAVLVDGIHDTVGRHIELAISYNNTE